MGIIRKALSGSAAGVTGGVSLLFLQFRSDTERITRELKLQGRRESREHHELMASHAHLSAAMRVEQIVNAMSTKNGETQRSVSSSAPTPIASAETHTKSITDRLADIDRLATLRANGVLSEEEFEKEKQAILGSL